MPTSDLRIATFVFDGISTFHVAAPQLVFGEVAHEVPGWRSVLWNLDGVAVTTAEGHVLGDVASADALADADLVIVPSWSEPLEQVGADIVEALQNAHARGATVMGLCLGSFAVAAAGLVDGRTVATHWLAAERLAAAFPLTDVDAHVLYVDHGDVMTSAGTAASIDACLHFVRTRLGADLANRVARQLVVAPHRTGGQAQYIQRPMAVPAEGDPLGLVTDWALGRLDQPMSVDDLALRAGMSRRSFLRHFQGATGTTPARWLTDRRLDEARVLLETTRWGVDRIAAACGFGSPVTFRQNFVRSFDTTPSTYRRQFSGLAPSPTGGHGEW